MDTPIIDELIMLKDFHRVWLQGAFDSKEDLEFFGSFVLEAAKLAPQIDRLQQYAMDALDI